MNCFECDKGKLKSGIAGVTGEVRGEKLTVQTEAMVCNRCGAQVLTDRQSVAYTVAIADVYRKRRGLLTSSELKGIRKNLGMSQHAFAKYLKVSAPSVKRWESGLIQDEAMDHLIRLQTDLDAARKNVKQLEELSGPTALTSGPWEFFVNMQTRTVEPKWPEADFSSTMAVPTLKGFSRDSAYSS